jgi:hypothetical protein
MLQQDTSPATLCIIQQPHCVEGHVWWQRVEAAPLLQLLHICVRGEGMLAIGYHPILHASSHAMNTQHHRWGGEGVHHQSQLVVLQLLLHTKLACRGSGEC